jgi:hypothetical protein
VICHGNGGPDVTRDAQNGAQDVQRGCCVLCGVLHTAAPVDPPQTTTLLTFERQTTSVVWREFALEPAASRAGSPEQARAPPTLS